MKTYSIKEVSKLLGLPSSTLRYYEELGILSNVQKNWHEYCTTKDFL